MNSEIIDVIKSKMAEDLLPEQLLKLENVLTEVLETNNKVENCAKDNKYLVKQFITAKQIEGCAKRTEEYYS